MGMTLSCSNNCIITRSNWKHLTLYNILKESAPILNGEQPEPVEDSEVSLNDSGCIQRAHLTAALSDWDPGPLNYYGFVWLLHTFDGLVREGHTDYWTKWTD